MSWHFVVAFSSTGESRNRNDFVVEFVGGKSRKSVNTCMQVIFLMCRPVFCWYCQSFSTQIVGYFGLILCLHRVLSRIYRLGEKSRVAEGH